MSEYIEQDSRYPEWMKAWNARAAEIDQEIIDYFQGTVDQTGDAVEEITYRVQDWWDRQKLDPTAKAEYEKAKSDAKLFQAKVENRMVHLVQDGKIAWSKFSRKAASGQQ
jgi:hypothetical protein